MARRIICGECERYTAIGDIIRAGVYVVVRLFAFPNEPSPEVDHEALEAPPPMEPLSEANPSEQIF
jgi:hypothetical protein